MKGYLETHLRRNLARKLAREAEGRSRRKPPALALRDGLMEAQCRTCARWPECAHRLRVADIETLCLRLIDDDGLSCAKCLRRRACDFECFAWLPSRFGPREGGAAYAPRDGCVGKRPWKRKKPAPPPPPRAPGA